MNIPSLQSAAAKEKLPEEAAEDIIRTYCGWHIAPVITETLTLDGAGGHKILLPSRKIIAVENVKIEDSPISKFRFSQDGWLHLKDTHIPPLERCLELTITHGYEQTPPAIMQIISAMIARAKMSPAGNILTQRAGTQSVTFASTNGQVASFPLMEAEKEILAPYKLTWGP